MRAGICGAASPVTATCAFVFQSEIVVGLTMFALTMVMLHLMGSVDVAVARRYLNVGGWVCVHTDGE